MARTVNLAITLALLVLTIPEASAAGVLEECGGGFAEPEGTPPRYGRGRPVDVKHMRIAVTVDFEANAVSGVTTITYAPVGTAGEELSLDAVDIEVSDVTTGDGEACEFQINDGKLNIYLPGPVDAGAEATISITHSARPEQGFYFRTEAMGYQAAEVQAWTQGEPEEARHWFPSFDYPNDKCTTEVIATVPGHMMALSNGRLVDTQENDAEGTKTFHWLQEYPHTVYLVALVVANMVAVEDTRFDVPIFYYVFPGHEADARLSLGKTPEVLRFLEERIGVKYPYAQYGQVEIVDFMWGGMENTGLTTLTERSIHGPAAHLTQSTDGLIAHEAAHQWWGDLLTCRDWSHLWLNEGFATYFEALYTGYDKGHDEFLYRMLVLKRIYTPTDKGDGRHPVVRRSYDDPNDLFDRRIYNKGAWVLHMLRHTVGDEVFFKALHEYCLRFRGKVVETNDLLRTVEDVTGKALESFFDQWIFHAGYPQLTVKYSWSKKESAATVTVTQTQTVDSLTPVFDFSTAIRFSADGFDHIEPVHVFEKEHTYRVSLPGRPEYVRFDPDGDVLAVVSFKKSTEMLLKQLDTDPSILGRIQAAEDLSKKNSDSVVDGLEKALQGDAFYGVRIEAAKALAHVDNSKAVEALLRGAGQRNARVRLAVAEALGDTDLESARATLESMAKDESPYVAAKAIESLGGLNAKESTALIRSALKRDSHAEIVRRASIKVLGRLEGAQAFAETARYARAGAPRMSRVDAIRTLGKIPWEDAEKSKPRNALQQLLEDPNRRIRITAARALGDLGGGPSIEILRNYEEQANTERETKAATDAIEAIRKGSKQAGEIKRLRDELSEVQETQTKLLKRLDKLEDGSEEEEEIEENSP